MKIVREYSGKQIRRMVEVAEGKGATNVHIHNPIVKVGNFRIGQRLTLSGSGGKMYKLHSFIDSKGKANLQLLTKSGNIDLRSRMIIKSL